MKSDTGKLVPLYNWDTIPAFDFDGIKVRGFRSSHAAIAYSVLRPNTPMKPPHTHDFEQIFMLLEGRVKLHVGSQVHDCGPGSIVLIPPHVEHWVEAPSEEDGIAINLDFFSPIRDDFFAITKYQTDSFMDGEGAVARRADGGGH
jgi:mannose-6-phosphate isomerase-like protein (cupin superfamily)